MLSLLSIGLLVLPLLCASPSPSVQDQSKHRPVSPLGAKDTRYTRTVLLALDKIVGYYEWHYDRFNLDGIFGLRVLEGKSA